MAKPPRPKKFLVRMTEQEDRFLRDFAARKQLSINDALCSLINARREAEEEFAKVTEPRRAPAPPPAPAPSKPPAIGRIGLNRLAPHPPLFNDGQTAIPTDDTKDDS